jgi:hypothetical protein
MSRPLAFASPDLVLLRPSVTAPITKDGCISWPSKSFWNETGAFPENDKKEKLKSHNACFSDNSPTTEKIEKNEGSHNACLSNKTYQKEDRNQHVAK